MKIAQTPSAALGLPTLGEVLRSFGARAFLDIELKVGGLEQETIGLVREYPPQKGYVVSSFLEPVLVALHGLDATIPRGFIFDKPVKIEHWRELASPWVMPHCRLANQNVIDQAHESGKKTMVWTVNDQDDVRHYAELGAEALISDDTEMLVRTLRPADT
jgi:glycerophosphoryl diester phosphodiesterase